MQLHISDDAFKQMTISELMDLMIFKANESQGNNNQFTKRKATQDDFDRF